MYIGSKPADKVLTASDITDGIVSNAKLAQDIISADTALGAEPADTDEFLVSDAGTLKRMDYSHIKGGITHIDQWRLNTDFDGGADITSNLERLGLAGAGLLGSAMTESSGIFTFPATGYWLITFNVSIKANDDGANNHAGGFIKTTTDNGSTWLEAAGGYNSIIDAGANNSFSNCHFRHIFDVTDVSNDYCKFNVSMQQGGSTVQSGAGSDCTYTGFTFLRLGDT